MSEDLFFNLIAVTSAGIAFILPKYIILAHFWIKDKFYQAIIDAKNKKEWTGKDLIEYKERHGWFMYKCLRSNIIPLKDRAVYNYIEGCNE